MTASQMGKKGAKKRWSKTTKQERSETMSALAKARWYRFRQGKKKAKAL